MDKKEKIIKDNVRVLINKSFGEHPLYCFISDFCKKNTTDQFNKTDPEEILYIVTRGLEHVSLILTCTQLHATHIPIILRNINASIYDLMIACDVESKQFKEYYNANMPVAYVVFFIIMENFGLKNILDQSKYFIENLTPLIWDWDDTFDYELSADLKFVLEEYFIPCEYSPYDNISQQIFKYIFLGKVSQAATNYIQEEACVSFKDIIDALDDSHRENITALKDFITDTIDEAELSDTVKDRLKKGLRDKVKKIKVNTPLTPKVIKTKEYVEKKEVQYEFSKVEAGGIGAQITKENNQ